MKWGNLLAQEAEHVADATDRDWLLFVAMQEYCSAHALDDDCAAALFAWSEALHDVAKSKQGDERRRLLAMAEEKHSEATEVMERTFLREQRITAPGKSSEGADAMDMESMCGYGWT